MSQERRDTKIDDMLMEIISASIRDARCIQLVQTGVTYHFNIISDFM